MFIMFTTYGNDAGKGFTAKITFGNIITKKDFYFFNFIFSYVADNLCQNALDLTKSKLIVDNNWLFGAAYCQWLISAEDENAYITLEFQNINVS